MWIPDFPGITDLRKKFCWRVLIVVREIPQTRRKNSFLESVNQNLEYTGIGIFSGLAGIRLKQERAFQ